MIYYKIINSSKEIHTNISNLGFTILFYDYQNGMQFI